MSEVKRYQHIGNLCRSTPVLMELYPRAMQYVLASDYDALAAKCERLRDTLSAAQRVTVAVIDERDAALAELAALKGGRKVACYQFQTREGTWRQFDNERHYQDTLKAGGWPIRALYTAPPAQASWRDHSVNYAKGEKPPQTIEALQAAWDRDQELLLEQKAEISRLKKTINQLRQKKPAQASAWAPEGWKLVPVEPTDAMRAAYERNAIAPMGPVSVYGYRAMLAAAPTPGASEK